MTQSLRGLMACALVGFIGAGCASSGGTVITPSEGPAPTVNTDFKLDAALARQGYTVYMNKGCYICHRIGEGRGAGPDLFGVTERRTVEWLTNFLKDTSGMIGSDPIAQALYVEFNHQKMPNIPMSDPQILGLIHYLQEETNRVRAKAGE